MPLRFRKPALAVVLALHAVALALVLAPRAAPLPIHAPALALFEVRAVPTPAAYPAAPARPPVVTRPAATSQPAPPVAPPPAQLASAAPLSDVPVPGVPASDLPQSEVAAAAPVVTPAAVPPALRDAYAQTLWRHIAACKPPGARRAGVTVVRFGVDRGGGIHGLAVAQSSGSASLDAIALRSVRRAAPLPRPPAELGDDLQFSVPFSFG